MHWIYDLRKRRKPTRSCYDLLIWQKGLDLTLKIYEITKNFPEEERFGLVSQMRRAVVSIPSNIAEGYGRYNIKELINFLRIAKGSLTELDTQLIISVKLNFISQEIFDELCFMLDDIMYMLIAWIKKCSEK